MARPYRMGRRAETRDRTRDRIVRATMELHDEQGVATTTLADVAKRAGVGQATISRHFPTPGHLIQACGGHVWAELDPPTPATAATFFAGIDGTSARLARLVDVLDDLYGRGALRLERASADRSRLPELEGFLQAIHSGVAALVREALEGSGTSERALQAATVLSSFSVWQEFRRLGLPEQELARMKLRLLECAVRTNATL